ncbi:MAG: aminomethyltransferase family protein [Pseudomonadota bacterium]
MTEALKTTPLNGFHHSTGANMAGFGGYDMPLWYPSGAVAEHMSVIQAAGLFDTSHMAVILLSGNAAFDLLQECFTKDLRSCLGPGRKPLAVGRCVYGAFLDLEGRCLDDAIAYRLGETDFMVVVNAGMGGVVGNHLKSRDLAGGVEIFDLSDRLGKMDLQGPASARVMSRILDRPGEVFQNLPYFSFKGCFDPDRPSGSLVSTTAGVPLLLSRTGYTGEFGFEIFVRAEHAGSVWAAILEAGRELGVIPCGLAARDSLRAGAVLPLSHQDIGAWPFINHPWSLALPWNSGQTAFTKSFWGDIVLEKRAGADHTLAFAGFDPRKVMVHDDAAVLFQGREIGRVLTCAGEVSIGRVEGRIVGVASADKPEGWKPRGLCCGFVKVADKLENGVLVELRDKRRKIEVEIVADIRPARTARRPIKDFL